MRLTLRSAAVTIVLGLAAGILGMWIGHQFFEGRGPRDVSLHGMVHEALTLTPEQHEQIESLEVTFAARSEALEDELRAANAELAAAILKSEAAGPDVQAAVHHFHDAMGEYQAETIDHVFAMRRILTPEQRVAFDEKIRQALTAGGQ